MSNSRDLMNYSLSSWAWVEKARDGIKNSLKLFDQGIDL